MNIFGRDCGCDGRKAAIKRMAGSMASRLARFAHGPSFRQLSVGEHFTIIEGTLRAVPMRAVAPGERWRYAPSMLVERPVFGPAFAEKFAAHGVRPLGLWVLGREVDFGLNTITDAAADFLADDFVDGTTDVTNMDWHHWGTGGGACASPIGCGATTLTTPGSEARVSGTASQPATRQYRTVATITADAGKTIDEWGLFSASSAGTAWSLRCFGDIILALNDAIEFTYTLTIACVSG